MATTAKIEVDGKVFEYPVLEGTEHEKAIDISKLRTDTGYITIDHGFMNTGSCASAVTFLDGEKGILRYRGYPIEQLAEKSNFIEVSYLLVYGQLPTASELKSFEQKIAKSSTLPDGAAKIIDAFPKDAHPMAVASATSVALSAFYPKYTSANPTKEEKEDIIALMLGQFKSIAAHQYRRSQGLDPIATNSDFSYCEDFMMMMFGKKPNAEVT